MILSGELLFQSISTLYLHIPELVSSNTTVLELGGGRWTIGQEVMVSCERTFVFVFFFSLKKKHKPNRGFEQQQLGL